MRRSIFLIAFGALLLSSAALKADGDNSDSFAAQQPAGSAAQFDKRLPPVLPGEEVKDGKETLKVWSTTGGVPVSQPPEPWRREARQAPAAGVIVDRRDDHREKVGH